MAQDDKTKNDTYQGPGKVTAALGTSTVYGLGSGIAGGVIGGIGGSKFLKKEGKLVTYFAEHGASKPKLLGVALVATAAANTAFLVGSVVGLIKGWRNATKGKAQFDEQREGLNKAGAMLASQEQTIAQQKTELAAANTELANERKRFTETIQPRAEHGSHAGAHEANKTSVHAGAVLG